MNAQRWPGSEERWARFVAWKRETFERGDGPRGSDAPSSKPAPKTARDHAIGENTPYGVIISIDRCYGGGVSRALCRAFDQGVAAGDWTVPLVELDKPPTLHGVFREGVIHWHDCPICHVGGGELCRRECSHEPDRDEPDPRHPGRKLLHGAIIACDSCQALLDRIHETIPHVPTDELHDQARDRLVRLDNDEKVALVYLRARELVHSTVDLTVLRPAVCWTSEHFQELLVSQSTLTSAQLNPLGRAAFLILQHASCKRSELAIREADDLRRLGREQIVGLSAGSAGLFMRGLADIGACEDGRPLVLINAKGRDALAKLGTP